jgi:MFS transporter, ACS family, pantothenate transporter
MRTTLSAWPDGTADYVNHRVMKEYIQEVAKKTRVDEIVVYGARVTRLDRDGSGWLVHWSILVEDEQVDKTSVGYPFMQEMVCMADGDM